MQGLPRVEYLNKKLQTWTEIGSLTRLAWETGKWVKGEKRDPAGSGVQCPKFGEFQKLFFAIDFIENTVVEPRLGQIKFRHTLFGIHSFFYKKPPILALKFS